MGFQPLKTVINIVLFVLFCVFFLLLIYSLFFLYPLLIRRYATCWQTKIHYVNIICALYVLDYSCMNALMYEYSVAMKVNDFLCLTITIVGVSMSHLRSIIFKPFYFNSLLLKQD